MRRLARALVLLAGLVAAQWLLYAPSLLGRKVLLPLDLLLVPSSYLPHHPDAPAASAIPREVLASSWPPHDRLLTDAVWQIEPVRQFAVAEVRAGRLPLWDPHNYCGAPFLAANQPAVFSPFRLLDYCWPSPVALAWGQMLRALVAGVGAYLFFRISLRARFAAALFGAWAWPLSGFLVIWTMWPLSATALWLPWMLLAIDRTVRRPGGFGTIGLALVTAASLVSGHSATGAQVLLAGVAWLLWRWIRCLHRSPVHSAAALGAGWLLGVALATVQVLPTLDYLCDSQRMAHRLTAGAETGAVGLAALPQFVLPWVHGSTHRGWIYLLNDNILESAANGYVGLLAVLVLLPIGLTDRRRRLQQVFWLALAVASAAYLLDLPGAAWLGRQFPLSSLRHNRMVFAAGFALLSGAVIGLDTLLRGRLRWSRWLWLAPLLATTLGGWCAWRGGTSEAIVLAQADKVVDLAQFERADRTGQTERLFQDVMARFATMHVLYAVLCGSAVLAWVALWWRGSRSAPSPSTSGAGGGEGRREADPRRRFTSAVSLTPTVSPATGKASLLAFAIAGAALVEVLLSAHDFNPQCHPSLYYPPLPTLQAIARGEGGRICGVLCLPPMLNHPHGLHDLRGYDAADPARYVQFLRLFAAANSPPPDPSAATLTFVPRAPSALADFTSLRYLLHLGSPTPGTTPWFVGPGHWIQQNATAMQRASVPTNVLIVNDAEQRLRRLSDPSFNPRATAIVESESAGPAGPASGHARITEDLPSQVVIDYQTDRDAVLVLADSWDAGWQASVNGVGKPVLRANHAFRAVAVPAGAGRVVFSYHPFSFKLGVWVSGLALTVLLLWAGAIGAQSWRRRADRARNRAGHRAGTPLDSKPPLP